MKKKSFNFIIFIFILLIIMTSMVFAKTIDYENICNSNSNVQNAVRIIGTVVAIMKWVVPLIIIVFGMIDFGKAIVSDDEKAVSKAGTALLRRLIAGIVVFFIPTIILTLINIIGLSDGLEKTNTFKVCTTCILDVSKCK